MESASHVAQIQQSLIAQAASCRALPELLPVLDSALSSPSLFFFGEFLALPNVSEAAAIASERRTHEMARIWIATLESEIAASKALAARTQATVANLHCHLDTERRLRRADAAKLEATVAELEDTKQLVEEARTIKNAQQAVISEHQQRHAADAAKLDAAAADLASAIARANDAEAEAFRLMQQLYVLDRQHRDQVADLASRAAHLDTLARQSQGAIADRDATIAHLVACLNQRDARIQALADDAGRRTAAMADLEADRQKAHFDAAQLRLQLAELSNSSTGRPPLRKSPVLAAALGTVVVAEALCAPGRCCPAELVAPSVNWALGNAGITGSQVGLLESSGGHQAFCVLRSPEQARRACLALHGCMIGNGVALVASVASDLL
eukprot:m51a1_g3222 hypothetical protein (383) ;mRNA; f:67562-69789